MMNTPEKHCCGPGDHISKQCIPLAAMATVGKLGECTMVVHRLSALDTLGFTQFQFLCSNGMWLYRCHGIPLPVSFQYRGVYTIS